MTRVASNCSEIVAFALMEDKVMRFFLVPLAVLIVCAAMGVAGSPQQGVRWDFEDGTIGQLPKGWTAARTGQGDGSVWKVVEDSSAPKGKNVLAQTSESPGVVFNLCMTNEPSFKDVELSVSFKAVRGKKDQGGGLVWRYIDANNYYVARMNPLEDNYRLFKVVNGKRTQLATKEDLRVPVGEWHVLNVTMNGDQIECSLDGEKHLEAKDGTFPKAGTVGLWTKADAQTYFDDFAVSVPKRLGSTSHVTRSRSVPGASNWKGQLKNNRDSW
jgi:3-keto-disaccharide hydrolase